MLTAYSNEIIALVSIIIVIYIYLKIKKTKSKDKEINKQKSKISDIQTETAVVEDTYYEESIIQEQTANTDKKNNLNLQETDAFIEKEEVSKHGKIVKENFKEFTGCKLLAAEDSFINQKVLLGLLNGSGIEIFIANNGQEALNILKKDKNFDFILMDIHMPIMDGFETTWKIRNDSQYDHIPIIALSGDTATDDVKKMKNAGMKDVLEKPLKLEALYDVFYKYSTNKNDKKEFEQTKEHLDFEKGLSICAYDEDFYQEILKDFLKDYTNSADMLKNLLEEDNKLDADKLLLDIVGITANIGAYNINTLAQKLKISIQTKNQEETFKLLETYKNNFNTLLIEIDKRLSPKV